MTTTTHPHRSVARWFADLFRPRGPTPLDLARAERWAAARAYSDAITRGDTRTEHHAYLRFKRATHTLMRLERENRR